MSERPDDRMNKSLDAVKKVSVSAPRPVIGNVAAGISPGAVKPAAKQPPIIHDAFKHDVGVRFAFLGSGQGGGRMADAFYTLGYRRAAVFNTTDADFAGLSEALPKFSLDVGGASKDMEMARQALASRTEDVRDLLTRSWGTQFDCTLICTSLGGGTGSGTAPDLVKIARRYMEDHGATPRVGAIVSLPTATEGYQICRNAVAAFQQLVELKVSPLIVIDNGRIHSLYRPPMAQLHPLSNSIVAKLLHLFNQLAAVHSQHITFDRSEFMQLLDSGLVVMGAADIQKFDSPADVSGAIRDQLSNNVLAAVDLQTGKKAACLFVGATDVLGKLDLEYFDAGYTALDRILGAAYGAGTVETVVHRGLYEGTDPGLQAYVMVGALDLPRARLSELAKKGGLFNNGTKTRTAAFLGVDDAHPV